jgi:hypothetical protein
MPDNDTTPKEGPSVSEQLLELHTRVKYNDIKIKALINVLIREGIVTRNEVESETKDLVVRDEGPNE